MKTYTIFYEHKGRTYSDVWNSDNLDDAILDAKYQLEDCGHDNKVLEEKTRELKENHC